MQLTHFRKTKIVATFGPSVADPVRLEELFRAGVNVVRLNFSHGGHAGHGEAIGMIRAAASRIGVQVGILQDLSGPKIRLGELAGGPVRLAQGETVTLFPGDVSHGPELPVQYEHLAEDLAVGSRILLADGLVELSVEAITGDRLRCTVLNEGELSSHKGVNLPLSNLRIPSFTAKDRADLAFGLSQGVDYVAMSFVRTAADLMPAREMIDAADRHPLLLAKIEKPEAIDHLEEILAVAGGTMVARGDLGVEMPFEELPMVQKRIITATRQAGKPVITATQMLRSMIDHPRPTRAETTDVANAILDGTSAVMLSEETAVGRYPVEAVRTLHKIALTAERHVDPAHYVDDPDGGGIADVESAVTRSACKLALRLGAVAIVVTTSSGKTARLVSRFRPRVPIIAYSGETETVRKLPMNWGVWPVLTGIRMRPKELIDETTKLVTDWGLAKPGDRVVLVSGYPSLHSGTTDTIKILTVPDRKE